MPQASKGFAHFLSENRISLLVATNEANGVLVLSGQGDQVGVFKHFFRQPRAVAWGGEELVIAGVDSYHSYRRAPLLAGRIDFGIGDHDAVYVPRTVHATGHVDPHDLQYSVTGQPFFCNTLFSCISTIEGTDSFAVKYVPPFVGGLSPDDKCHLNGLGMVHGWPRLVTFIAKSSTRGGWRRAKVDGGMVWDIENERPIMTRLCMPHNPRIFRNNLYFCEAGKGTLMARKDEGYTTKYTVAKFSGFVRGLEIFDHFAFVGVSKIRNHQVLQDLPIARQLDEDQDLCGIFVVDLNTNQIEGFVVFNADDDTTEVFDLSIVDGYTNPALIVFGARAMLDTYELRNYANEKH